MNDLVIFDIETTGTDKNVDHIVQISAIKVSSNTGDIIDEFNSYVQPIGNYTMGLCAYLKHRISAKFLQDKPTIKEVGPKIVDFIGECDLITYNGHSFDIPFLNKELSTIGLNIDIMIRKCYDVYLEEKNRHGMHLTDVFERYNNKTMEEAGLQAHDAMSDVKATLNIFKKQRQIKKYGPVELITDDNFLTLNKEFPGHVCFNVGKYRDCPVIMVKKFDQGYIDWVVNKSTVSDRSKKLVLNAY